MSNNFEINFSANQQLDQTSLYATDVQQDQTLTGAASATLGPQTDGKGLGPQKPTDQIPAGGVAAEACGRIQNEVHHERQRQHKVVHAKPVPHRRPAVHKVQKTDAAPAHTGTGTDKDYCLPNIDFEDSNPDAAISPAEA